jgi:glycosyltransferase involved in cell wall biosynthesis
MKILVVCGAGKLFGKEAVTLSLMDGLRNRGHEVKCITTIWNEGSFEERLEKLSIPSISLPLGFISKTLSWSAVRMTLEQGMRLPALWRGYRKEIISYRPDIVLHSGFHHVFLLWPLLGGEINVFHVHDAFAPTRFYRQLFKLLSRRIKIFVGVSKFVADSLLCLGLAKGKITFVLNGVDVDECTCLPVEEKVTERTEPIRIGIVGQIDEWKGHEDLIDALHILEDRGQPFLCRIFGEGSPEFALKLVSRINEHKLTEKVEWMGFIDDRNLIYNSIDICVVPSRFPEPFGMVAAEAGLHGLPVVASRRGGLPEVVVNGKTGYVVDAEAPEQLAEKIWLLLNSPEMRIEMGRNGSTYVSTKLNSKSMNDKMDELFESLISQKQGLPG